MIEKRSQKIISARLNIFFKCGSVEGGLYEAGKNHVVEVDDKYFEDYFVKLPKTSRDALAALV